MKNAPSSVEGTPASDDEDAPSLLLQMGEMYHRVSNSLNLISCRLQLQARQSDNPEVRRALQVAVDGINGLARLHGRLYGHGAHRELDAVSYLKGLVSDLQSVLLGTARERHLELTIAQQFVLGGDELVSLGSVVTELVINAIKYGAGTIAVTVQHVPGRVAVVVEDQGPGFPAGFGIASDAGFGLHLVREICAKTGGSASIDRAVAHGRVSALIGVRADQPSASIASG